MLRKKCAGSAKQDARSPPQDGLQNKSRRFIFSNLKAPYSTYQLLSSLIIFCRKLCIMIFCPFISTLPIEVCLSVIFRRTVTTFGNFLLSALFADAFESLSARRLYSDFECPFTHLKWTCFFVFFTLFSNFFHNTAFCTGLFSFV